MSSDAKRMLDRIFGRVPDHRVVGPGPDLAPWPEAKDLVAPADPECVAGIPDPHAMPPREPPPPSVSNLPDMGDMEIGWVVPPREPPPPPPSVSNLPDMGDMEIGWVVIDYGETEKVELLPWNRNRIPQGAQIVKRKDRYGIKRVTDIRPGENVAVDGLSYEEALETIGTMNGVIRDVMST